MIGITNKFASYLASFGFICFLLGRVSGAAMLRRVSAHRILGLYAVLSAVLCLLVFCKLGWLSVVCVFLSYFFMSIMFPTIFALGIFGLGNKAKGASAYLVMAIVGRGLAAQADGGRCRSLRHVPGLHRAFALFRDDRGLRLHVAQTEPRGIVTGGEHVRRALTWTRGGGHGEGVGSLPTLPIGIALPVAYRAGLPIDVSKTPDPLPSTDFSGNSTGM